MENRLIVRYRHEADWSDGGTRGDRVCGGLELRRPSW